MSGLFYVHFKLRVLVSWWLCCSSILSLVHIFIITYSLSYIHYHIFIIVYQHKKEQRKIKIGPRVKLNYNSYSSISSATLL